MSPVSKKIVNLRAELTSDNVSCDGFIENLSEDNICCTTTAKNLAPGTEFQVKIQSDLGEVLNLDCKLTWSYETPPYGVTNSIGMEILNQPTHYRKFLDSLQ
jgi:hypothetical protein